VDIELRHLRSFVAVAEELNFTRAAKRLFIAQQALSTQIRQLEERIGAKLLDRDTRSVTLASAGEVLLGQARLLLADADAAFATTRAAVTATSRITVGFVAAVNHPAMSDALDRFSDEHPDVDLMINFGDQLDPTGGLLAGHADVAFVYGPFDSRGLDLVPLYSEPMGVAMAAGHPLAEAETISIADVVAEPTFDFPTSDPAWRSFWDASEFRRGTPPKYVAQFRTLEGLIASLRAGLGVYLATAGLAESAGEGVVWRRMDELPALQHYVSCRANDERPLVRAFVSSTVATLTR